MFHIMKAKSHLSWILLIIPLYICVYMGYNVSFGLNLPSSNVVVSLKLGKKMKLFWSLYAQIYYSNQKIFFIKHTKQMRIWTNLWIFHGIFSISWQVDLIVRQVLQTCVVPDTEWSMGFWSRVLVANCGENGKIFRVWYRGVTVMLILLFVTRDVFPDVFPASHELWKRVIARNVI